MDYIIATYTAFSLNLSHMPSSGPRPEFDESELGF